MANFFETRRAELKLTQRQIAEAFDPSLSSAAVSAWECGVCVPQPALADQAAKIYQVSLAKILEVIHANARANSGTRRGRRPGPAIVTS